MTAVRHNFSSFFDQDNCSFGSGNLVNDARRAAQLVGPLIDHDVHHRNSPLNRKAFNVINTENMVNQCNQMVKWRQSSIDIDSQQNDCNVYSKAFPRENIDKQVIEPQNCDELCDGNQSIREGDTNGKKKFYKKKYRWTDPKTGYKLYGAGIIFYDDNGIWVIGESKKNGVELTDMGGKYNVEDGNICATIARELSEETYHTCELTRSQVETLSRVYHKVYMLDQNKNPIYVCLIVPLSAVHNYGVCLNPNRFLRSRRRTLNENPDVPKHWFNSLFLYYIGYDKLDSLMNNTVTDEGYKLSYRLKSILRYAQVIKQYIPKQILRREKSDNVA